MRLLSKNEGATYTLHYLLDENKKKRNNTRLLHGLQEIRDTAWCNALKYRFDPHLRQAHEEYLHMLNEILEKYTDNRNRGV